MYWPVPPSIDPVPPSTNCYRLLLTQYHHISTCPAPYWPSTTKYQSVLTYTGPVPSYNNQYRFLLTQYHQHQPLPSSTPTFTELGYPFPRDLCYLMLNPKFWKIFSTCIWLILFLYVDPRVLTNIFYLYMIDNGRRVEYSRCCSPRVSLIKSSISCSETSSVVITLYDIIKYDRKWYCQN